jgi:hypothetical protein
MKGVLIAIGMVFLCFMGVAIVTATPLVGEVVMLHTQAADASWETTPLWIVDTPDGSYLRAGNPDSSGWVLRWHQNPAAKLERNDQVSDVRLVAESDKQQAINELMSERYGWADEFVGLMGDRSAALPLRVVYIGGRE